MVDLLYCEVLKLKRSKMFLISVLGIMAAPFMCFVGVMKLKAQHPEKTIFFSKMFSETNLYILLLIGVILYGVIAAYLFCREYSENTLKNILTIPVSKTKFIIGKYIMLFLWIIVLTAIAWFLTLLFGVAGQLEGLNGEVIIESLRGDKGTGTTSLLFYIHSTLPWNKLP